MTTPLQQAAQELIDRWDSPMWRYQQATTDVIAELRKALDAEIAHVPEVGFGNIVEPVAHFNMAINETVGCIAYEYGKHNLKSGTPLYLHPAPQQAVTSGERAELIAKLRDAHGRRFVTSPSPYSQAADMLEADAQQAKQVPLSDDQIEELAEGIAWDDYAHDLTRRVEKHHGIGGEA